MTQGRECSINRFDREIEMLFFFSGLINPVRIAINGIMMLDSRNVAIMLILIMIMRLLS